MNRSHVPNDADGALAIIIELHAGMRSTLYPSERAMMAATCERCANIVEQKGNAQQQELAKTYMEEVRRRL